MLTTFDQYFQPDFNHLSSDSSIVQAMNLFKCETIQVLTTSMLDVHR